MAKNILRPLLIFAVALFTLTACEENITEDDPEYDNWKARNETYFEQKMTEAKAAIATAKAQYGDDWENHCSYRILRNYSISSTTGGSLKDSICVEIVETGSGTVVPYYTDSVRVNSTRRLIPTDEHPEGKLVDHTGYTVYEDDIFNDATSSPVLRAISSLTKGEATALQQMHIGDRWKITSHYDLAYGTSASSTTIPDYSTMISEIKLRGIYRRGTDIPDWK